MTLVAVLSIVAVVSVYAVWIGAFQGGEVTVGTSGSGSVTYSLTNADPWESPLNNPTSSTWYSKLELAGGYSGPVGITWKLQKKTATSTWDNITSTPTSLVLTGSAQTVYASTDGSITLNHNWQADTTGSGTYRIIVEVNSA